MEPMTLGSPAHSPGAGAGAGPGYLPPFLLGEVHSPSAPRTASLSPTQGRNLAFGSPTSPTLTSTPDQRNYRQGVSMHQQALYNQQHNMFSGIPESPNISYSNKPTGPPIEDLFDTIRKNEQSINKSHLFYDNNFSGINNSLLQNSQHQSHLNGSVNCNESMNNPWQDSYQERAEEHWVTVFGFPSNLANTVLARLSTCGSIIDKQYPTQGNWAHVRFATRAEKERAMALNSRQITPGIMVGVVNCKEPPRISMTSPNATINSLDRSAVAARPLCPTALPSTAVPQGSTGYVAKAMEYIFGW